MAGNHDLQGAGEAGSGMGPRPSEPRPGYRGDRPCGLRGASPLLGILVMMLGVWLLMGNLGILRGTNLGDFWPAFMIAFGLSALMSFDGRPQRILPGVMATALGILFLLNNLDVIHGDIGQWFWPAMLIAFGVALLIRRLDADGGIHPDTPPAAPPR